MQFTTNDIASALDITLRAVGKKAKKQGWIPAGRACPGGIVYDETCLPGEVLDKVRRHLFQRQIAGTPVKIERVNAPFVRPAAVVTTDSRSLTDLSVWERETGTARLAFVDHIERAVAQGVGKVAAVREIVGHAKAGALGEGLADLVQVANARSGKKSGKSQRTLSYSRLFAWCAMVEGKFTPSERIAALAPKAKGRKWSLDEDVAQALAKLRQPNKPPLAWCVREVIAERGKGSFGSLEHRCRRELKHIPAPVFYAGRNTGAALRALQPFRRREFQSLHPNDVWIGDGHGAKMKVAHPNTGNPFQPEVTVIMDVQARYVVGWSVSLSENCLAVSDALRHGVSRHGVPLVYYSDNGGGQKNKMFDAPVTGTLAAIGVQHETGIPGNPQGRGVIERFWQTALISLARRFATFQGRGADRDTLRNVSREILQQLRAAKNGEVTTLPQKLPTWAQFIDALDAAVTEYNETHRHSSLPKLDGTNYATPAEYRAARVAETGTEIHIPSPMDLAALFMPHVTRKCQRGEVRLFNGVYFHKDLTMIDGREAPVGYDIHDCSKVWVKHPDSGSLIAVAELDGNRGAYFPKPFIERLREERAKGRMGRLKTQFDEVRAELAGGCQLVGEIEHRPVIARERTAEEIAAEAALEAMLAKPATVNVHALRSSADKHAHWMTLDARRAAGEVLAEQEEQFWSAWQDSDYFAIERDLNQQFEQGSGRRADAA